MSQVKLAIVYYSATGTNYQLAKWAEEGGKQAGADVRVYKVPELASPSVIDNNPAWKAHADATKDVPVITPDDIAASDAIIFSVPTRYGNIAAPMKQFLDTTGGIWSQGKTVNKVVSAMTSAQNPHGGQEATILALYTSMYHWGAIVVAPGYTDASLYAAGGNPYGTSVSAAHDGTVTKEAKPAAIHQAKRVVMVADWLKKGMQG